MYIYDLELNIASSLQFSGPRANKTRKSFSSGKSNVVLGRKKHLLTPFPASNILSRYTEGREEKRRKGKRRGGKRRGGKGREGKGREEKRREEKRKERKKERKKYEEIPLIHHLLSFLLPT